jgi:hypothetical protein
MREQCPGWHMGWCIGWVVFCDFSFTWMCEIRGSGGECRCGAVDLGSNAEKRGVEQGGRGRHWKREDVS